jgi:hypothetical protein
MALDMKSIWMYFNEKMYKGERRSSIRLQFTRIPKNSVDGKTTITFIHFSGLVWIFSNSLF